MNLKTVNDFWSNTKINSRIELVIISYIWSTFELTIRQISNVSYLLPIFSTNDMTKYDNLSIIKH